MKRSTYTLHFNKIVLLIIIISINACITPEKHEVKNRTLTVRVEQVQQKVIPFTIHCSGRLASKSEVKLGFKTGGIIDEIYVDEGQMVKKGQLLAKLKLSEINATVRQALLGTEKAKRDFNRVKNLYNDSVATLEQYQNAETALKYAEQTYNIANFNLEHSSIYAPGDGRILKKLSETNEMVAQGYPVFLFGQYNTDWIIRTNVVDKDRVKIQLGDSANVKFDVYPEKMYSAEITELGSIADPYTGTYEIELKIKNPESSFASGYLADIEIISQQKTNYLLIPIDAMIEGNENIAIVYEWFNHKANKRELKISHFDENYIYVKHGLSKNAKIITSGAKYIDKNSIIKVIE